MRANYLKKNVKKVLLKQSISTKAPRFAVFFKVNKS